ncbi:MAG: hypothetical protein LGL72_09885 [Acidibrevibacterium sp.]|jgi:hypothetical protein|uniref:hypothetical protein n=1 Tax=Acidibrevibacterium fodinaquatile TaxID=1969806 RepID=UPI0023A7D7F7|nr:hypothetical protein [Acidibrevibacterium fodinaquatile]MCA7119699.1 hypothetical protein [Acidibrevibacterium fodinaquatile]
MIGITLLPEQIRAAPPEIRRWLEAEIAATFAPGIAAESSHAGARYGSAPAAHDAETRRLVACDLDEARAILSLIQGMLPVVSVFFELGREPIAVSAEGLRVLRLDQMMQHAHLRALDQLAACLQAIDAACERVRGVADAALTVLDGAGHCLVAEETGRSVFLLWQEIVATHDLGQPAAALAGDAPAGAAAPPFSSPYAISVPPLPTPGGG